MADLVQAGTLKTTHLDKCVYMLHDLLAIEMTTMPISEKLSRQYFVKNCTTKGRDGRCRSGVVGKASLIFCLTSILDRRAFHRRIDFAMSSGWDNITG